jgi:DNA-directed RNA polymerase specialized sigma24 family protein
VPHGIPTREPGFHTTHWSVILAARQPEQETAAREALAALCSMYWYPLYAFIRRQGLGPHESEDLTQEFFYHFLKKNALEKVSPTEGKFRSFLLACLKNFLANQRERANAQRRGGGTPAIALEGSDPETKYLLEPADNITPEVLFERCWASSVLERALGRLREEYRRRGQSEVFNALEGFLPGSDAGATRAQTAARFGMSAGALDMAICRVRQRYGAMLREEVAQTVASADEVEQELRYFISVFEQ